MPIVSDWSGWSGTGTRRRSWFGERESCFWQAVGKSLLTVRRWRRRYMAKGVDGLLKAATRPPGRKPLTAETIKRVVHMTLHEKPPNATQWSLAAWRKRRASLTPACSASGARTG